MELRQLEYFVAVEEVGDLVRGAVSIATDTAHNVDMPALLARFHIAHPGVEITLGTDDSDALIDGVLSGRLDLAIVSVAALADRPLIALPVGTGIRRRLDDALAEAGVRARIALEASSPVELADLAAHGLGVAIVPQLVSRTRTGLHPIAIRPQLRGRLALAWRASGPTSPAARVLIGMARHQLDVTRGA